MIPMYGYMDSHPHQKNQVPFAPYFYPNPDSKQPYINLDPSQSPVMYESWPYGNNHAYSAPHHTCCYHNNVPGGSVVRLPYPHSPLAPQFQCCGSYPSFPVTHPVQYVPPPHYLMEQPRYEYYKDRPRDYHCCGCPNHVCRQKNDGNVKIEEQEPEVVKKGSHSLVPVQTRNYPYPIAWIPSEYMRNREKPSDLMVGDQEKDSHNSRTQQNLKSVEQEPRVWNGWVPLDMNSLKSFIEAADTKKTQNQQKGDKFEQSPFPVIWLPPNKQAEGEKKDHSERNDAQKSVEERSPGFRFIQFKVPDNDDDLNKPKANAEECPDGQVCPVITEEAVNQKSDPAKKMEVRDDSSEEVTRKVKDIPVKQVEDTAAGKPSGTIGNQHSPSPPKKSKLPPVCLRVDPLPKKNGNGKSRSPSPPGLKERPEESMKDTSKGSVLPSVKDNGVDGMQAQSAISSLNKEVEPNEGRKIIKVMDENAGENEAQSSIELPAVTKLALETLGDNDTCKCSTRDAENGTAEDTVKVNKAADSTESIGEHSAEAKKLSEEEAATFIQSVYRGYEVRKWEPLRKLKQISDVSKLVDDVRDRIQALESSSDLQKDDRRRMVIGEMIMSLLLRLDSIQDLNSSLRDLRKSLARELVKLQEKLDSLASRESKNLAEEVNISAPAENLCFDSYSSSGWQKVQDKEVAAATEEQQQGQLHPTIDVVSGTRSKYDNIEEPLMEKGAENEVAESGLAEKTKSEGVSGDDTQKLMIEVQDESMLSDPGQPTKLPPDAEENTNVEEFTASMLQDSCHDSHGSNMDVENALPLDHDITELNELKELPQGVLDDEIAIPEIEKDEINKESKGDAACVEIKSEMSTGPTLYNEVEKLMPVNNDPRVDSCEESHLRLIENSAELGEEHGCSETKGEIPLVNEPLVANKSEAEMENCATGSQTKEELPVDVVLEELSELPEMEIDNELLVVSEPQETNLLPLVTGKGREACLEDKRITDVNDLPSESAVEKPSELSCDIKSNARETPEVSKLELDKPEVIASENYSALQSPVSKAEVLVKLQSSEEILHGSETSGAVVFEDRASLVRDDEQAGEIVPVSHSACQIAISDSDPQLQRDQKLVEENEKLREMMEKLIEAGQKQLTVISNLTGRVKDLEKKLSRQKKLRRGRTSFYSAKRLDNSVNQRVAAAM